MRDVDRLTLGTYLSAAVHEHLILGLFQELFEFLLFLFGHAGVVFLVGRDDRVNGSVRHDLRLTLSGSVLKGEVELGFERCDFLLIGRLCLSTVW